MGRVRSNTSRTARDSQHRVFKCSECDKCFASKRYLKKHSARGHTSRGGDDGELACSMCTKTFTYLSHLRRHQLSHLNVREHECAHCEAKFVQRTHLLMHVARKHALLTQHPANASDHAISSEASDELRKVQCTECDAFFETQWHLTRHQNRRHKERICLTCGEKFASASALREHSSQHDATRTHHCAVCQRRFHRSSELKVHEQLHAAQGSLLCVHCNAVFIQRTQLDRHIARAHDVRRSCATCAEHFSAITQYCSHMRIIHSEMTCAYCGSTDRSREHREATHWRRLAEPRSLTVPAQQLQPDQEEPTLKLVVLLNDRSVNNGGLVKVYKGFPPGLIDAFPGLADLEIRVTDFAVDESVTSVVLSFPVEPEAVDDPRVANFTHTPIYIDLKE